MLLPLKPKSRQTAAISGKQDFAQRRSKRRRDHQRLLSKLRNIIPRIVQNNPNRPQSQPRQQAQRAAAAGRTPQSPKAAGAKRRGRRRDQGPQQPRAPNQPSGPNQQRPHRRSLAAASPKAGAGLSFQNTPQTSVAPCPRLRGAGQGAHMVEDVLKTKPGPRRTGHTTRRAA